jgi:hypothetical protein
VNEDIVIPVTTGDTVMMGKFKNKKTVIKSIGKDKHSMPTINGKQATTFRMTENEIRSTNSDESKLDLTRQYQQKVDINRPGNGKPNGMWYQINDSWTNYCTREAFLPKIKKYNFNLDVDMSSIFVLDSVEKFNHIVDNYGFMGRWGDGLVNWNKLCVEYKGIEIPNYNTLKNIIPNDDFYNNNWILSWDINSGCIWDLTAVKGYESVECKDYGKDADGYADLEDKDYYNDVTYDKHVTNEATESDVDLSSFEVKKELNTKFWNDKKINLKVRRRLLKIADDFLEYINIDSKYCKDILFLGSLCNYNWSKYSDVDLHLLIDFNKINKDVDLVRDYFDAKRKLWNSEHDSLKIYGFPIEIYIQDVNEVNSSTSVFSLEKNKWLKIPKEEQEEELDKNKVKQKSADLMTKIDDLKTKFDKKTNITDLEDISKKVKSLFDSIKKLRKSGLESKKGEFSVGNIVFKVLRRSGYMETLVDLKRNSYDKINTIK